MKAIIFDFDGVIHDTFEFHRGMLNEFAGVNLSVQEFKDIHNGNFFNNVPDSISGINWDDYKNYIYSDISSFVINNETKDILYELKQNFQLFVISSGGTKNITDYLKNNQVLSIFEEVLGFETHKSKTDKFNFIFKQNKLLSDDCVFVTDTLGDILEANIVKVKTIAVDYGFHDQATLQKGNPEIIISHLRELVDYLHDNLSQVR